MADVTLQDIEILTNRKVVTTITDQQVMDIMSIYPDEPLIDRAFFQKAIRTLSVSISEIRAECDKLNIPWQLFLLEPGKLLTTINAIKNRRTAKFDERLIASRDGRGRGISLRIADRVIALQEYAKTNVSTPNEYCNSLVALALEDRIDRIIEYFEIDVDRLHGRSKTVTLDYLIERLEYKDVRVARGVLSNKIMPKASDLASTYRKSSGFIVHDERVPYIFLPSEVSEQSETTGRQILTLLSLVYLLGMGEHNTYVNGELKVQRSTKNILKQAYEVAGKILLPISATDELRGTTIDSSIRDELATKYMLTPSAIIVTLRKRDIIRDDETMQELLESIPAAPGGPSFARTPKMETSVRKFCGDKTATEIMNAISHGNLKSIPAQYLLFGHIDKKHFAKLKSGIGL